MNEKNKFKYENNLNISNPKILVILTNETRFIYHTKE